MKKSKSIWMLMFVLTAGISVVSCTKDDDLNSELTIDNIEESMESGIWRITLFEESGEDETSHFAGYDFAFGVGGILTAENGANSYEGTWSASGSESNDDSSDDLHFNIFFNLSNDFEDLNDDWDVISNSDAKIELIDVSGGNGGTDYLSFEQK